MTCNTLNISAIEADPNFKKFLEYGGYAAGGIETAFGKYADLLKKGLIEPGKEKDAAVKAFADSYQWLSERASTWLNDLPANGPKAEAYKNSVAQGYIEQAQKLQNTAISADAKLAQLTADVNQRIESVAGKGVTNYLGRAFDAAQIATAFAEGDMAGVYSNLAQMVGAEMAGIAAGAATIAAVGFFGATAPAWAIALAAGAGATFAAALGKSLYDDFGEFVAPHAEAFGRWVAAVADNLFDCEMENIKKKTQTASSFASPIVLDLDGDGVIRTIGLSPGVNFDHAADGFAERTGWVAPGDGLLVWDRNANGTIDSGRELLGSETVLPNGLKALNGFEALKAFDANNDGVIDANDPVYAQLRVWVDGNTDGRNAEGELLTLKEAGVKSINVGYANSSYVDAHGNAHKQVGSYTTTDDQTRAATDVWFTSDVTYSTPTEWVDVPDDIAALPDAQGYGKVRDLHQAMAMDATGELKALVTAFVQATTPQDRDALLTQLIYRWTGVQNVDPASRTARFVYGNAIGDARKLEALEEFMGEEWMGVWCWGTRDPNPHGRAAPVLLEAWADLKAMVYGQLIAQSHLSSLFQSIAYRWDAETESVVGDLTAVALTLATNIKSERDVGLIDLGDFLHALKGMGLLGRLDGEALQAALAPLGADVAQSIETALNGWVAGGGLQLQQAAASLNVRATNDQTWRTAA